MDSSVSCNISAHQGSLFGMDTMICAPAKRPFINWIPKYWTLSVCKHLLELCVCPYAHSVLCMLTNPQLLRTFPSAVSMPNCSLVQEWQTDLLISGLKQNPPWLCIWPHQHTLQSPRALLILHRLETGTNVLSLYILSDTHRQFDLVHDIENIAFSCIPFVHDCYMLFHIDESLVKW